MKGFGYDGAEHSSPHQSVTPKLVFMLLTGVGFNHFALLEPKIVSFQGASVAIITPSVGEVGLS